LEGAYKGKEPFLPSKKNLGGERTGSFRPFFEYRVTGGRGGATRDPAEEKSSKCGWPRKRPL